MTFETAYKINSAGAWIAFALIGVRPEVDPRHIETIRGVSLAQMQTAKEVIEAHNAQLGAKAIHCVCEDRLLAKVKLYADAFQGDKV